MKFSEQGKMRSTTSWRFICREIRYVVFTSTGRTCQLHFRHHEFSSMIVCGLPASPHDLVHESDARRRLLRVPR